MMTSSPPSAPRVLIVGGSLVGLSAAIFLAHRGVATTLVEKHTSSHPHPRAVGYTPRTLELFRTVGLGETIPQVDPDFRLRRARVHSLSGEWYEESDWTPGEEPKSDARDQSPCQGASLAQDRLEPILRQRADELGATLCFGAELVEVTQDAHGVTATIRDREGRTAHVRADYMIAADGAHSPVREALGITRSGRGHIRIIRSVLFRAALEEYVARGVHQFQIDRPELRAFITTYGDDRWVLMCFDDRERSEEELREAIMLATGRPDLDVEIIVQGRWDMAACVADSFQRGRIFLAGDAAHQLPPTRGGYGANTGIHDVYDLSWMLAEVLSGRSQARLLECYEAERRPVAWQRMLQTFARPDYARDAQGIAEGVEVIDGVAMELGERYRSAAIWNDEVDEEELPPAALPSQWRGMPGTRAPHLEISCGGEAGSLLDLFGAQEWVVLSEETQWREAVVQVRRELGLMIRFVQLDEEVCGLVSGALSEALGVSALGATLVRPDGVVAWRTRDAVTSPADRLREVLTRVAAPCAHDR